MIKRREELVGCERESLKKDEEAEEDQPLACLAESGSVDLVDLSHPLDVGALGVVVVGDFRDDLRGTRVFCLASILKQR